MAPSDSDWRQNLRWPWRPRPQWCSSGRPWPGDACQVRRSPAPVVGLARMGAPLTSCTESGYDHFTMCAPLQATQFTSRPPRSDQWPRVGRPPAVVDQLEQRTVTQQPRHPPAQRRQLRRGQQLTERGGRSPPDKALQGVEVVGRQRLPAEIPDHGAQLVVLVEAQAVFYGPEAPFGQQHVPALSVVIVGGDIESAQADEGGVPLWIVAQGEVVRSAVLGHEALHRAAPEWSFGSLDRLGHESPPERF